ncbi:VOC family protein [uncultured Pseudoteredinibacter sp.]|uniref:VOC family protein n=1 Tax=uncultured Pseudoteredinibacter sp. TaxID=1641701 RepID=UPI00260B4507|nr:VOC family protein [uncultured Pseudoteredinibacter sp.]
MKPGDDIELPEVRSESSLSNSFLGDIVEIAIVTPDADKTMQGLVNLGIGPWRVYTFSPENTTEQTYQGLPAEFEIKVCFAQSGNVIWELMEPLSGPTIFADYLKRNPGGGIQHIAYDCGDTPMVERFSEFERRGYRCVQSGKWLGVNHFAFFDTEDDTAAVFETYYFPKDFEYPEPDYWYPSMPFQANKKT